MARVVRVMEKGEGGAFPGWGLDVCECVHVWEGKGRFGWGVMEMISRRTGMLSR